STAPAAPGTSEAAAAAVVPSVVQIMAAGSTGSGFVYDARGHVITNHHVVAGRSSVRLQLHDGRTVAAQVVGTSAIDDIAVLRATEPGQLTRARIGRSGELRIGQPVIAVGSPLGLSGTVTAGIVSSVDRQARIGGSPQRFVQTDAPINPGNSGGPLVDLDGRVVGVNTAIATVSGRSSGSIGIGFAVPMERAQQVANRLIRGG
ncbi:S1C family serine protease, partial [Piscicoccus intestinalis]|uniref:S1C family serine protease n=1 Tax=Piscicoccus intestinalis TaxID=746033 RepID=UPI0008383768